MSSFYPTTQPPTPTNPPPNATHNNSTGAPSTLDTAAHERFKIRELTEGWLAHRDTAEWAEYRSTFHSDAYIATFWFRGSVDSFIEASKKGFEKQGRDDLWRFALEERL
jgi:hypothetical protein